jgi:hypothetical protein
MSRETIPQKTRNALLDEYDHRCAVCGGDRPHVHHIDEDATHNSIDNLLPLCPNCHLRDQHNPSRKIDIEKLKLFRKHKDPAILKPQFHPIYTRLLFLDAVQLNEDDTTELEVASTELIDFVSSLEMGDFYSKRLSETIAPIKRSFVGVIAPGYDQAREQSKRRYNHSYREKLITNRDLVRSLIVEQLRYQTW